MTLRKAHGVKPLRLGKRADEKVSGTEFMKKIERIGIGAGKQHQQCRLIGLDTFRQGANRVLAFGQGAPGIDDRNGRARGEEARFDLLCAAGADRLPAGAFGKLAEFVAMTKGQDEQG